MFEKYSVVYSCIISTYLFIQKAACCTLSEDTDTQNEAPPPPYVVQIGGLGSLRAVLSGLRPQLWWHWLQTLTLPWFSSLFLLLFLQTPGWEIVQSCFLLRCWSSECWKRHAVGEGPSESRLGSWQCGVEEEGPSLCPGSCLALGRSQALFRSQLSYLPTVWPWVNSVSSLNLLLAVCGFALNRSHSPHVFACEEPGCHSFPGIPWPSLLSLVFSGFSQRAFPLPVFPQILPRDTSVHSVLKLFSLCHQF